MPPSADTSTDVVSADATTTDAHWWRQAVVYQIYPRSFADDDGDGLGDLRGIISRADYLADLGIDAVWLSPFYPSALADGGYDVADYRDVDPRLGTLDDFDEMVAALHTRGIRIVVDIVPNHTSDDHAWFAEAVAAGRGSAARERYVFRDGTGPGGSEPPTDWESLFGGPAWERVADGQWYLHHFAVEQPDLNWASREVRADFLAHAALLVRPRHRWFPHRRSAHADQGPHRTAARARQSSTRCPSTGTTPSSTGTTSTTSTPSGEPCSTSTTPRGPRSQRRGCTRRRVPLYASQGSLGQAFNFDLLEADFDAAQFRRVVTDNLLLASETGSSSTWVLSNHDVVRHPTRYGLPKPERDAEGRPATRHGREWLLGARVALDREAGMRRARAATLFLLGLPGSAYLYQGEELGLHEVEDIPGELRQDPTFFRNRGLDVGRDGCRVPLPWSSEAPSFGFGTAEPHLPQPDWMADHAVTTLEADPDSTLWLYRHALRLRRRLLSGEDLTWHDTGRADVLHFERHEGWHVVTNFGTEGFALDSAEVLIASGSFEGGTVPGETTVWFAPRH